jgi:23S rRNA maturation mini-RNase III
MRLAEGSTPYSKQDEIRIYGRELTFDERMELFMARLKNASDNVAIAITPIGVMFDTLDGSKGTYDGINCRTFKSTIDMDFGRYLNFKDALQEGFISLAQELKLDEVAFERIAIYATMQQKDGDAKLQATLSPEQYKEFQNLTLTENEMKWYKAARQTLDSTLSDVKKIMYEEFNAELDAIIGYFPFISDFEAMSDAEIQDRFGSYVEKVMEGGQIIRRKKNPEMGFTKKRVGGKQRIRLNAFEIMMKHTDDVAYFITMTKNLRLLQEIAKSDEYMDIAGDRGRQFVNDWLDVMARKGGVEGARQMRWLDTLRRNMGVGTLGFKLSSILILLLMPLGVLVEIGCFVVLQTLLTAGGLSL